METLPQEPTMTRVVLCGRCNKFAAENKTEPMPGKAARQHKRDFGCRKVTVAEYRRREAQKTKPKKQRGVPLPVHVHADFGREPLPEGYYRHGNISRPIPPGMRR